MEAAPSLVARVLGLAVRGDQLEGPVQLLLQGRQQRETPVRLRLVELAPHGLQLTVELGEAAVDPAQLVLDFGRARCRGSQGEHVAQQLVYARRVQAVLLAEGFVGELRPFG